MSSEISLIWAPDYRTLFSFLFQYARDFYIGQWLYDAHLELDRVLKENPSSPLEALNEDFPDATGEISSSGIALQQSELKKDTILSFLDSKKMTSFKGLGSVLDERSAAVVTRYLASSRALTKSFDTYLQKVVGVCCIYSCMHVCIHVSMCECACMYLRMNV